MKKIITLLFLFAGFAGKAQVTTTVKIGDVAPAGTLAGVEPVVVYKLVGGQYVARKTTAQAIADLGGGGESFDTTGKGLASRSWTQALLAGYVPVVSWSNVSGKPSSFPPSAHTHLVGEIQTTGGTSGQVPTISGSSVVWGTPSGGGGGTWGSITGTLSAQTDLNAALAAKQTTLVAGTNIKNINGQSPLGSGNIAILGSDSISTNGTVAITDTASWPTTDNALALWGRVKNAIAAGGGGGGGISGSGTANYLPMFTGSTAVGNSKIYEPVPGNHNYIQSDYINNYGQGFFLTGSTGGSAFLGGASLSNIDLCGHDSWSGPGQGWTVTIKSILVVKDCPVYANDAAADADASLPSGGQYKLTGGRQVYIKP